MPEACALTVAGVQVPVMPLVEVVGKVGTAAPAHIVNEVPKLKRGTTLGFTVIVKVVGTAHKPAVGVNV